MVIIGGLGSIEGAVLGALYLVGIPAAFGSGPTVQFITSGVGLTIFILFLPGGLAALLHRIGDAVSAGLGPAPSAARAMRSAARPGVATREREATTLRTPARLEVRSVVVDFGGLRAVDAVELTVE